MKRQTTVEGSAASHQIIDFTGLANRDEYGAADEALERIRHALMQAITGWRSREGVRFHVVLTVERPE